MLNTVSNFTQESYTQLSGGICLQSEDFKKSLHSGSIYLVPIQSQQIKQWKKSLLNLFTKQILNYDIFVLQYVLTLLIFLFSLVQNPDNSFIIWLPNRE